MKGYIISIQEAIQRIQVASSNGISKEDIAAEIGMSRKTLYSRLKGGNFNKIERELIQIKF